MSSDHPAETLVFKVEDMSCGHCVSTIRQALAAGLPDAAVAIDLGTKEVRVAGDAAAAAAILREAGYEPVLLPR